MSVVSPKSLRTFSTYLTLADIFDIVGLIKIIFEYYEEKCECCLKSMDPFTEYYCRSCLSQNCLMCHIAIHRRFIFYRVIPTGKMACLFCPDVLVEDNQHRCYNCNDIFDCKEYSKETNLCKCEQTINQCQCEVCVKTQGGRIGLVYYCSEGCERTANEPDRSDDD
jgi:hypothetical protein